MCVYKPYISFQWKALDKEKKEVYEALAKKQQAEQKAKEEANRLAVERLQAQQQVNSPQRETQSPQQPATSMHGKFPHNSPPPPSMVSVPTNARHLHPW